MCFTSFFDGVFIVLVEVDKHLVQEQTSADDHDDELAEAGNRGIGRNSEEHRSGLSENQGLENVPGAADDRKDQSRSDFHGALGCLLFSSKFFHRINLLKIARTVFRASLKIRGIRYNQ